MYVLLIVVCPFVLFLLVIVLSVLLQYTERQEFEDTNSGISYIEEEQTTQWPKEKIQKDKQRSTKHTCKAKDRVTRTPLKTGVLTVF
jgi:hypothetical protein